MERLAPKAALEEVKKSKAQKVKLAITDIDGILRGKYINREKFLSAADGGFGFCNVVFGWDSADVCYDNVEYTGWHTGYPDAEARIDLGTLRHVPWDNGVPFFLADFVNENEEPLSVCPRQTLKRIIQRASDAGFKSYYAMEFEWFNFQETPQSLEDKAYTRPTPLTPGMFGYSLLRSGQNREFFNALMDDLLQFDVPLEGIHTETGPGVYEAAIQYSDPLEAADRAVLFKSSAKEIGHRFGIMPSFMAKWDAKLPGCSGHIHQSLLDAKTGENLFYDGDDRYHMSETFKSFLAGQMHCLPEILPLFAPTINSYKRLVEGLWAPTKVTWSADNRTASLRVIPGSAKSTRLETRVTGSDVNPYLAIAAALAAGLYGIENKMKLEAPAVVGNAYKAEGAKSIARNLHEATEIFANSKIAVELFGEAFVSHYAKTREWEWRQFQEAVTDWEIRRYFEII